MSCLLGFVFLMLSCAQSGQRVEQSEQTDQNKAEQEKMRRSMLFGLIADSRIETLSAFAVANDYSDLFGKDSGPILLFAPTNEAFEKVDSVTLRSWRDQKNGMMKRLIGNHIVKVDQLLTALNGSTLKIIQEQQAYYLEDVKGNRVLIGPNPLRMDNGDIYYLDEVLY
jgi:uncharacterized surface protein with fasciclin (FAS1) repeats